MYPLRREMKQVKFLKRYSCHSHLSIAYITSRVCDEHWGILALLHKSYHMGSLGTSDMVTWHGGTSPRRCTSAPRWGGASDVNVQQYLQHGESVSRGAPQSPPHARTSFSDAVRISTAQCGLESQRSGRDRSRALDVAVVICNVCHVSARPPMIHLLSMGQ